MRADPPIALNLRRAMVRLGLTLDGVVERTGLDRRTVRRLLAGDGPRPQARTLHRLATGLDLPAEALFENPNWAARRALDRDTNPAVDELLAREPRLVEGWGPGELDELYSRFGAGGGLTEAGVRAAIEAMKVRREVLAKVALVLETDAAELLVGMVDLLYGRVLLSGPAATSDSATPDAADRPRTFAGRAPS